MATFTAGTSFTDGVTGDVTAAKLNALVANATPLSNFITDRTAETSIATDDLVLISDTSDSGALNKMTVANLMKAEITGTINSTAGTITTGVIPTLTSTTLITSGTGTAASPAIVPTGDTNTGIFFPAADTVGISTGGTERVRVDSSGRVGIGTSSPDATLQVVRATSQTDIDGVNQVATFLNTSSDTSGNLTGIRLRQDNVTNTAQGFIGLSSTGNSATRANLVIATPNTSGNSTERLRIDSSGNVGVGTSSPTHRMSIDTSAQTILSCNSTDANGGYITFSRSGTQRGFIGSANPLVSGGSNNDFAIRAENNLVFATNTNTERLRIDSSGNVGIGTASPTNNIGWTTLALNSSANGGLLELQKNGTRTFLLFNPSGSSDTTIQAETSNNLILGAGGTERLRIDSSGNVGIGTTSPSTKLHVASGNLRLDDNQYILWGGNTNGINGNNASNLLAFYTNSTERLRIDSSGFVSIGTATGLSALHVHGNVTLSNTTTATSAGTGGLSKPATYAGYLTVSINGTSRKIPYYAT